MNVIKEEFQKFKDSINKQLEEFESKIESKEESKLKQGQYYKGREGEIGIVIDNLDSVYPYLIVDIETGNIHYINKNDLKNLYYWNSITQKEAITTLYSKH